MIDFVLTVDFLLVIAFAADLHRRLKGDMWFHGFSIYLVFHGFVFLLRPFLSYHFNFNAAWQYIGIWPTEEEYLWNLVLAMLGLTGVYLGSVVGLPRERVARGRLSGAGREVTWRVTGSEFSALMLLAAFLLPVGMWSLVQASHTHEAMILDSRTGVRIFTEGSGYFYELYNVVGPILFLIAFLNRMRLASLIPLGIYFAFRVQLGWGRFGFVLLMMSMLLFWIHAKGFNWRAIGLPPLALLLFQFAGRMRGQEFSGEWYQKLDTLDFANFEYLTFVTRVVPDMTNSYTYFLQYLQLLTEPIPRALWPDKPIGAPIQMFNLNEYGNFTGLTVSLVGDGWMSLGYVGVAVMTVGTGYTLSRAFNWFVAHRHEKMPVLIYIVALPACVQWFRDGGFSVAKFLLFLVGPLLLWVATTRLLEMNRESPRRRDA